MTKQRLTQNRQPPPPVGEYWQMLNELCQTHDRVLADMVRKLIRDEHARMGKGKENMSTKNLPQIVSDGYNMAVVSITDDSAVISIGGSRKSFDLAKKLSSQLDAARQGLGCTPLLESDKRLIDEWQSNRR